MALVTAILGLAGTLGLDVIAEGIEHQSQLHRLVELGCLRGQGFLMARPLGTEAAVHFIAESAERRGRLTFPIRPVASGHDPHRWTSAVSRAPLHSASVALRSGGPPWRRLAAGGR